MSESLEMREYWLALFDCYGELLTPKQKSIFMDVYEADLSFSEIAENLSISKAAVSDSVKRTCTSLKEYEEILGVYKKRQLREELYKGLENGQLSMVDFLSKIRVVEE